MEDIIDLTKTDDELSQSDDNYYQHLTPLSCDRVEDEMGLFVDDAMNPWWVNYADDIDLEPFDLQPVAEPPAQAKRKRNEQAVIPEEDNMEEMGEYECCVCLEVPKDDENARTPCNHFFCKECLLKWLKACKKKDKKCPICRTVITYFSTFEIITTPEMKKHPKRGHDASSSSSSSSC